MTTTLAPVNNKERIELLDILRGFAILGIFIMNLLGFTFYWAFTDAEKAQFTYAHYDHTTRFLQNMLLEGKFYSIFSMLFGIGFAIYLSKAKDNNDILAIFRRRLAILLIIGFIHLLLWSGDIVALYAMLGFALIPFRKFSNKALLIIAGLCILSPIGWYALKMSNPKIFDLSQWLFKAGDNLSAKQGINSGREYYEAMQHANFFDNIKYNLVGIFYRYGDLLFQSRAFKVFGMFLIGLVIGKTRLYNKLNENRRLLWAFVISGIAVGLPANYIYASFKQSPGYDQLTIQGLKETVAYALGVVPLALGYVAFLSLLYLVNPVKRFFNLVAPVGKMALTNYIMHTMIGLIVFSGVGLALPAIGPTQWTIFAVCVFVVQVILSTAWLKYFNYGPLEWLWRSATYKKWQPMRKKE